MNVRPRKRAAAQQPPESVDQARRCRPAGVLLGSRVSGSSVAARTNARRSQPITATNTARQPNGTINALPASGARIGETLNTSMTKRHQPRGLGPGVEIADHRARNHRHRGGAERPGRSGTRSASRWSARRRSRARRARTARARHRAAACDRPCRKPGRRRVWQTPNATKNDISVICVAPVEAPRSGRDRRQRRQVHVDGERADGRRPGRGRWRS